MLAGGASVQAAARMPPPSTAADPTPRRGAAAAAQTAFADREAPRGWRVARATRWRQRAWEKQGCSLENPGWRIKHTGLHGVASSSPWCCGKRRQARARGVASSSTRGRGKRRAPCGRALRAAHSASSRRLCGRRRCGPRPGSVCVCMCMCVCNVHVHVNVDVHECAQEEGEDFYAESLCVPHACSVPRVEGACEWTCM